LDARGIKSLAKCLGAAAAAGGESNGEGVGGVCVLALRKVRVSDTTEDSLRDLSSLQRLLDEAAGGAPTFTARRKSRRHQPVPPASTAVGGARDPDASGADVETDGGEDGGEDGGGGGGPAGREIVFRYRPPAPPTPP
jgi:hypothetical protein